MDKKPKKLYIFINGRQPERVGEWRGIMLRMGPGALLLFLVTFSIRASDSIIVMPEHPTTQDSIHLSIVFPNSNPCCPYAAQVSVGKN